METLEQSVADLNKSVFVSRDVSNRVALVSRTEDYGKTRVFYDIYLDDGSHFMQTSDLLPNFYEKFSPLNLSLPVKAETPLHSALKQNSLPYTIEARDNQLTGAD